MASAKSENSDRTVTANGPTSNDVRVTSSAPSGGGGGGGKTGSGNENQPQAASRPTNGAATKGAGAPEWHGSATCKWFNVLKGWGFISPDNPDDRGDIFVHQSVVKMEGFRSLAEGEPVEFKAKLTNKGYEATEVTGPQGENCAGSPIRPLGHNRSRRMRCFNCGKYGKHIAAKCPMEPQSKACYRCRDPNHLIGQCPAANTQSAGSNHSSSDSSPPGQGQGQQGSKGQAKQEATAPVPIADKENHGSPAGSVPSAEGGTNSASSEMSTGSAHAVTVTNGPANPGAGEGGGGGRDKKDPSARTTESSGLGSSASSDT